jgi:hypothetical protein
VLCDNAVKSLCEILFIQDSWGATNQMPQGFKVLLLRERAIRAQSLLWLFPGW